jgi:hypothetical protein
MSPLSFDTLCVPWYTCSKGSQELGLYPWPTRQCTDAIVSPVCALWGTVNFLQGTIPLYVSAQWRSDVIFSWHAAKFAVQCFVLKVTCKMGLCLKSLDKGDGVMHTNNCVTI